MSSISGFSYDEALRILLDVLRELEFQPLRDFLGKATGDEA